MRSVLAGRASNPLSFGAHVSDIEAVWTLVCTRTRVDFMTLFTVSPVKEKKRKIGKKRKEKGKERKEKIQKRDRGRRKREKETEERSGCLSKC